MKFREEIKLADIRDKATTKKVDDDEIHIWERTIVLKGDDSRITIKGEKAFFHPFKKLDLKDIHATGFVDININQFQKRIDEDI
jgi:hypothetical protein